MSRLLKAIGLAALVVLFTIPRAEAAFFNLASGERRPVELNSQTIVDLAEKLKPAVVNIDTEATVSTSPFGSREMPRDFKDFFERFFGQMPEQKQRRQGTGSGFLITPDGYIVTNNHVVEDADRITVRTLDKKIYEAKVIGRDPKTDVALIKVEAKDLPHVTMGDSDKLRVGEWVLAIGNPFGLDFTVTAGIVSAKGRVIGAGPYDDFIQTDAAINFGNSGGPLFDFEGNVVGMNTAIIARGQGIGFAVPVNVIKDIVGQLKDTGKVVRAELGVLIQPVTKELAESFGLKEAKGALISQVMPDSPAERAGLRQGDIIVEFNGKVVDEFHDLPKMVNVQPVGSKAKIKIIRDGEAKTVEVVLGEQKERTAGVTTDEEGKTAETPKLGIKIQNITPDIAEGLGLEAQEGVVITEVASDSPAQKAGLRQGDVVLEVNRKPVKETSQFAEAVKEAKTDKPLLLLVQRGKNTLYVPVKWETE